MTMTGTLDEVQQRGLVRVQTSETYGPMNKLRAIPDQMEGDWEQAKSKIKEALGNHEIRVDVQQGRINEARNSLLDALERRSNEARDHAAQVQADMRQVIHSYNKTAADGVDQTMMLRYWTRTEKALNRDPRKLPEVIQEAEGMRPWLEALSEELPDWLEAAGFDARTAAGFMEEVERLRLALAPPHIQEAHQLHEEAGYLGDGLAYRKALYSQRIHAGQLFEEAKGELRAEGGFLQRGAEPPRPVEGQNLAGWPGAR